MALCVVWLLGLWLELQLVRCFQHWFQKLLKRSYPEQVLCMSPQTNSVHIMSPSPLNTTPGD